MLLEETLESSLECKKIKPAVKILKEINPEGSFEGLMLKLQYFGCLIGRANSSAKTLMMGKIEGKKRRGQQRMRWQHVGSSNLTRDSTWAPCTRSMES